jgi:bacillithiol biosynthesis cysteine-adding enzyme BshC
MVNLITKLSFYQSGFNKLLVDYYNNDSFLLNYAAFKPNFLSFESAIKQRQTIGIDRKLLSEILIHQYEATVFTEDWRATKTYQNIKALNDENTFTVTTGHQLNIVTGPLYFIYKILSVVKQAEMLKKQFPKFNFVPVYWMATEDHDLDEINHVNLQGKRINWQTSQSGSVGRMTTDGMDSVIEELKRNLENNNHINALLQIVETAYLKNHHQAEAMRSLVQALFGDMGVVVCNADDVQLKKKAIALFEDDLINHTAYKSFETLKQFEQQYGLQIHAREVNLFYLTNQSRKRIVKAHDHYKVLDSDISFSTDEILEELRKYSERFSPNVLLRPLYQELILPNLAYTGGPAEVHYWLQLKPLFNELKIFYPMVLLRNSLMLVEKEEEAIWNSYKLKWEELFLPDEEIVNIAVSRKYKDETSLKNDMIKAKEIYDELLRRFKDMDPTLEKHVLAEWRRLEKRLIASEKKLIKALKNRKSKELVTLRQLLNGLKPSGTLQERYDNIFQYLSKYGLHFLSDIYQHIEPIPTTFNVYSINGVDEN